MATVGLTPTGLVIALIPDIRDDIEADFRTTFFRSLPLGDQTLLGHWAGIVSERVGLAWEALEAAVSNFNPDKATGAGLRDIGLITGTFELPPTSSVVVETLCGDPTTVFSVGGFIATASTSQIFQSEDLAVIAALDAWTPTTAYVVPQRVTNASRCYQCVDEGTSASSGGPTTTGTSIIDGSATWLYLGEGTGAVDVTMTSVSTGPVVASSGDLSVIQSPAFGLKTAFNVLDATPGRGVQSDQSFRLLREAELQGNGGTTKDATRSALLKLDEVESATVFMNTGDTADANGLPPHSFMCLVLGGEAQDIVDCIANNQPEGIASFGTSSGFHTDSEGVIEQIFYTIPTNTNIFLDLTIAYDASQYPSNGDAAIQAGIVLWGDAFTAGTDVDPSAVGAQAFAIPGVTGARPVLAYTDAIGTPAAWIATHAYVSTVGSRSVVTNDGGRHYICKTGGTSGSTGPTGVGLGITDGSVVWDFLEALIVVDNFHLAKFDSSRINIHSAPRAT